MTARKIIIDTDPGVDDAMAIYYALRSPELEVIGLTTVFGNAATPTCTQNALRLMEIAGRSDIPVAEGASRPLGRPFQGAADFVHGSDGQGDTFLAPPHTRPDVRSAAQFLIDQIMAAPGEITIVALGPLTNLALAYLLQPAIGHQVREIVLMGGAAFVPGNVTPAAEANIWNDPIAADIVFSLPCPVTMIGLDVTEQIVMNEADFAAIAAMDNPMARHIARIAPFYLRFYQTRYGTPESWCHVHDSTTITYLLNPALFTTKTCAVRVETSGLGVGKTWPALRVSDQEAEWAGRNAVTIAVGVDARAAIDLELSRLANTSSAQN